jgi:hypothetical protein
MNWISLKGINMILIQCHKCKAFVKDESERFEVRIQTGIVNEHLLVCQKCYDEVTEENYESKLILECV